MPKSCRGLDCALFPVSVQNTYQISTLFNITPVVSTVQCGQLFRTLSGIKHPCGFAASPSHAAFLCKSAVKVIHRHTASSSQDLGNCFPRERHADGPMGYMQPTPGTVKPRRQAGAKRPGRWRQGSPFRRPFPAMCSARHQANRRARLEVRAVAADKANNRGKHEYVNDFSLCNKFFPLSPSCPRFVPVLSPVPHAPQTRMNPQFLEFVPVSPSFFRFRSRREFQRPKKRSRAVPWSGAGCMLRRCALASAPRCPPCGHRGSPPTTA